LITTSIYNILSSNVINLLQYALSIVLNKNQKSLKSKAIKIDLALVIITIIIPIFMIFFKIENHIFTIPFFILLLFLFYKISNNAHKLYGKINQNKIKEEISKELRIEDSKEERKNNENVNEMKQSNISIENFTKKNLFKVVTQAVLLVLVGFVLYFIGNALSNILDSLCRTFNVSEFIIGILLGFITSIPELITFFESQKYHKKEEEGIIEATGNLFTSNIMNLCIIQSIGILIYHIFQ